MRRNNQLLFLFQIHDMVFNLINCSAWKPIQRMSIIRLRKKTRKNCECVSRFGEKKNEGGEVE